MTGGGHLRALLMVVLMVAMPVRFAAAADSDRSDRHCDSR